MRAVTRSRPCVGTFEGIQKGHTPRHQDTNLGRQRVMSETVVVGGGAVGCAVARALALEGVVVHLFEEGRPGRKATWAGAGMLSPLGEALDEGPLLDLALRSLRMYPQFVQALEEETGLRLGYRASGKVLVGFDEGEESALRTRAAWGRRHGFGTEWISAGELRTRIPGISEKVRGGLLIPEDHQVENRTLGPALWSAAERAGATMEMERTVSELVCESGRVVGVRLDDGILRHAERVVVAAGAWSGRVPGVPVSVPVRPVRGQIVALRPDACATPLMAASSKVYLVPREDGRLLVGATMEEVGFDERVTAEGVLGMLQGALELLPSLGTAAIEEVWAGLRPATPDGLPVLGPDPEVNDLFYATGHFRNGILLAPVTGNLLRDLILGRTPSTPARPFLPDRFRERT